MQNEKHIAEPRHLTKRGQASLNLGTWEFKFIREEWPDIHRFRELRDDARHTVIADECGFRLLQRGQVFNEIGELLERETCLQSFRHERNGTARLFLDLGGRDRNQLAVRAHQLHSGARRLLEDTHRNRSFFRFHDGCAIARRDGG